MKSVAKSKLNLSKHYVQKFRARLSACKASKTILTDFDELIDINARLPETLQCRIEDLFEDICLRYNFTAPFESDGRQRTFRASLLDCDHPQYKPDIGGNFIFSSTNTPAEEQCYRRGYSQGFAKARSMIEEKFTVSAIENKEAEIQLWRTSKIQLLGTLPGEKETTDYGVVFSRRSSISLSLRYKIFERDANRCKVCGGSAENGCTLEVDHIVPVSKGGGNEEANLQTLCWECNRGKSNRH